MNFVIEMITCNHDSFFVMKGKEEFIISGDGDDMSFLQGSTVKITKSLTSTKIKNSNFMKLFEFVLFWKRCILSHQLSRTYIQLSAETSFSHGHGRVRSHKVPSVTAGCQLR